MSQCVASYRVSQACCSVWSCVAVCCGVLQCVAVFWPMCCSASQCVAVCCLVLQCDVSLLLHRTCFDCASRSRSRSWGRHGLRNTQAERINIRGFSGMCVAQSLRMDAGGPRTYLACLLSFKVSVHGACQRSRSRPGAAACRPPCLASCQTALVCPCHKSLRSLYVIQRRVRRAVQRVAASK